MGIEVRKLSPDLLDDWLEFFDKVVFETSDEWEGCYCMCYHWNKEMQQKKPWNFTKADGPYNRHCAIKFIKAGKMQGYLAYVNGKVVGWVNANNREVYGDINFTFFSRRRRKEKSKINRLLYDSPRLSRNGSGNQIARNNL